MKLGHCTPTWATPDTTTVEEEQKEEAVIRNHHLMTGMQEMPSVAEKWTQNCYWRMGGRLNADPAPARRGRRSVTFCSVRAWKHGIIWRH